MNIQKSLLAAMVATALAACSGGSATTTNSNTSASATSTTIMRQTAVTGSSEETGAQSVAATLADNSETHESLDDYAAAEAVTASITLAGDSITVDGDGVKVDGTTVTITSAGTFSLSGNLSDGQVVVDTSDADAVRLVLNGVVLASSTSAPLYVANAEKVLIELSTGTQNAITDGSAYGYATLDADEPNAAIFSASDLTIYGDGVLTVTANYGDGIASKDGLIIAGGSITVNAADDGIRGKDYIVVEGGSVTVAAQGDGLKSDNEEDPAKGYISIQAGSVIVTSGGDAISAKTDVTISNGTFVLTSGGGSSAATIGDSSAKAIVGSVSVIIDGGTFTIDAADDALHSNGTITINGGTFAIASGDDGMHADAVLVINGGDIRITRAYEGIESALITIAGGSLYATTSDDGINVGSGNDGSGVTGFGGLLDSFVSGTTSLLTISNGTIVINATGDGIDINGAIVMSGGTVLVNGPTGQGNGALDYDGDFALSGGLLVAAGSSGMAMAPSASSTQSSVLIYFTSVLPTGTLVNIQDASGDEVLSFTLAKDAQSLVVSSSELTSGETYTVYLGGATTGTAIGGLVTDGDYTPGTENTSFLVTGSVTQVGSGGRGGGRP